ncbi:MAG: hypothetical protein ACE5KF_01110 [Kiloniellaceae bacterium]
MAVSHHIRPPQPKRLLRRRRLAPALDPGQAEFEIEIGGEAEPWHASNGRVAVTVFPSENGGQPSKMLNGRPALLWKQNAIKNACTPRAVKEQWLIAELDGVFVHVHEKDGQVSVVVAPRRF